MWYWWQEYGSSNETLSVKYQSEWASGLAKTTIERTKITLDLAQKTIGSTTLYSQWNIVFNIKRYNPTPVCVRRKSVYLTVFFNSTVFSQDSTLLLKSKTKHSEQQYPMKYPKCLNSKTKHSRSKTKHWQLENEAPYFLWENPFEQRQKPNFLLLNRSKINFLLKKRFVLLLYQIIPKIDRFWAVSYYILLHWKYLSFTNSFQQ